MTDSKSARTKAGQRLLNVMAGIPPDGRKGLAYFVDAIETEARNLGYADRLDEHIEGLCDVRYTALLAAAEAYIHDSHISHQHSHHCTVPFSDDEDDPRCDCGLRAIRTALRGEAGDE